MSHLLKKKSLLKLLSLVFFILVFANSIHAGSTGSNLLADLEDALVSLADKVRPSVVSLSAYVPPSPSIRRQGENSGMPASAGSGVIIDGANGIIVTNGHVVRGSGKIKVTLLGGDEKVGTVLGTDEDTDLAVVQIESETPLSTATLGDSSSLKIGQLAVAVGNPYGLNDTLTFGIISGLNRENVNLSRYEDFIQTDASINPGNSGGPLLNIRGEIIGINTAIINYAQSIGFAIPSNIVRKVVDELLEFGEVRRGWLGVGIELVTEKIAQEVKGKAGEGVWVNSVFEGDPAHRAGVRIGDVILKIGGTAVGTPSRMIRLIGSFSPGQSVNLDILRDGKLQIVTVKLENQKKRLEQASNKSLQDMGDSPLGIEVESLDSGKGIIVSRVFSGSVADEEGLKVGDLIEAINGRVVLGPVEFKAIIDSVLGGAKVHLLILRNNDKFRFELIQRS
ncbi:MAG: PDZ domain-containing protein [Nitrospina sp.]|nr:PDZ domain-containing protein [Nitrospina sp.]